MIQRYEIGKTIYASTNKARKRWWDQRPTICVAITLMSTILL